MLHRHSIGSPIESAYGGYEYALLTYLEEPYHCSPSSCQQLTVALQESCVPPPTTSVGVTQARADLSPHPNYGHTGTHAPASHITIQIEEAYYCFPGTDRAAACYTAVTLVSRLCNPGGFILHPICLLYMILICCIHTCRIYRSRDICIFIPLSPS